MTTSRADRPAVRRCPRASRGSGATATYVCCAVQASAHPASRGPPSGLPGLGKHAARSMPERASGSSSASAPLPRCGEASIHRGLHDLDWVSRAPSRTKSVVERFVRRAGRRADEALHDLRERRAGPGRTIAAASPAARSNHPPRRRALRMGRAHQAREFTRASTTGPERRRAAPATWRRRSKHGTPPCDQTHAGQSRANAAFATLALEGGRSRASFSAAGRAGALAPPARCRLSGRHRRRVEPFRAVPPAG